MARSPDARPRCFVPPGAWAQAITDALGFPNSGSGAPYECVPAKAGVPGREHDCIIITAPGVTQVQLDAVMRDLTPETMETARQAWRAEQAEREAPPPTRKEFEELKAKLDFLEQRLEGIPTTVKGG